MSLSLVFRSAAQAEFDEAALWYEDQCDGLGFDFIDEVERVLHFISSQPDRHPLVLEDVRTNALPTEELP